MNNFLVQHIRILLALSLVSQASCGVSQGDELQEIPKLNVEVVIDGDITEWAEQAFSDGAWDLDRVKRSDWYHPKRNRLNIEENEDSNDVDLSSKYYMTYDDDYLFFGAIVIDNVHDVNESKHAPKRWYYKDAIAWFLEVPKDSIPEKFELGNHAFAFVLDPKKPDYGAWWRHGSEDSSYVEERIPTGAIEYEVVINELKSGGLQYVLEARVEIHQTVSESASGSPKLSEGDRIGCMIVHCDPDGGEYGGHLLIYGESDDDQSWYEFQLVGSR